MASSPRLRNRTASRAVLAALAVLVLLVSGACGDTDLGVTPAAAEVNGKAISGAALDEELTQMRSNSDYLTFLQSQGSTVLGANAGTFDADFVRLVLTRQIYLELVHQAFVDNDLEITPADLDAVRRDVANETGGPDIFEGFSQSYQTTLLRRSAEIAKLQRELSGTDVTDEAVRQFYEENREQFVETCSRHILFGVVDDTGELDLEATAEQMPQLTERAVAAQARIAAGEDFAALAGELSVDAGSASQGGDLGCGPAGRFVPEFETAMEGLEPGQVSAPVSTQFGVHLIQVTSRDAKPFDEVADQVRQQLQGQASQGFGTFLREQLVAAVIEVNPRYGTFSKEGQNPGIRPPNVPTTLPVGASTDDEPGIPDFDLGG